MIDDRDRNFVNTTAKLEDFRNKAHAVEVEFENISAKYNDAVEDGQTKKLKRISLNRSVI